MLVCNNISQLLKITRHKERVSYDHIRYIWALTIGAKCSSHGFNIRGHIPVKRIRWMITLTMNTMQRRRCGIQLSKKCNHTTLSRLMIWCISTVIANDVVKLFCGTLYTIYDRLTSLHYAAGWWLGLQVPLDLNESLALSLSVVKWPLMLSRFDEWWNWYIDGWYSLRWRH